MLIYELSKRIMALNLNLKGKVVLTEAATGAYVVTPILAALAGAKVFAFTKNTRYGTVAEVVEQTKSVYDGLEKDLDITFIDQLSSEVISQADIITNSGHLRPLTKEILQYAKDSVVIPLMYEAWEWRDTDMDICYIRQKGIKVGATNERHTEVDVFNFLGDMAVKQILDAGLCMYQNKFLLLCNNDFGPYIAKVVAKLSKSLGVIDKPENKHKYQIENVEWIGNFPEVEIPINYKDAVAVIFTAYPFENSWIGDDNQAISVVKIKEGLSSPLLLRFAGDIDTNALDNSGIMYYPKQVPSGHMGILPSAIGYAPVIRLQAGGLKAGEALLSGNFYHNDIPIVELV